MAWVHTYTHTQIHTRHGYTHTHIITDTHMAWVHTYNSYLIVIGVHEMHGQIHPNYCQITILLVIDLCSSLAYFMMTRSPLPIASKLPIKTLVARQLPTYTHTHGMGTRIHTYAHGMGTRIHTYTHTHMTWVHTYTHNILCTYTHTCTAPNV